MPDATPPVPASAVTSLLKIANWEGTPQEIYEALTVACSAEDYQDCIKGLKERQIDPQLYINNLDKVRLCSTKLYRARFITSGDSSLTVFQPRRQVMVVADER